MRQERTSKLRVNTGSGDDIIVSERSRLLGNHQQRWKDDAKRLEAAREYEACRPGAYP